MQLLTQAKGKEKVTKVSLRDGTPELFLRGKIRVNHENERRETCWAEERHGQRLQA